MVVRGVDTHVLAEYWVCLSCALRQVGAVEGLKGNSQVNFRRNKTYIEGITRFVISDSYVRAEKGGLR